MFEACWYQNYSLFSPLSTKKNILLFIFSPNLYIKNQVIKSYSWIFDYNFTKKQLRIRSTLPHPLRLEWYMSDMFRFCVQDSNQKKSQRTSWSSKKKFLGKWLEFPFSHLFIVIIQKRKTLGFCPPLFLAISLFPTPTKLFPFLVVLLPPHNYSCPFSLFLEDTQSTATTLIQWKTKRLIALEINITDMAQSTDEEEEDRFLFSLFLPLTLYYSIPIPS